MGGNNWMDYCDVCGTHEDRCKCPATAYTVFVRGEVCITKIETLPQGKYKIFFSDGGDRVL